MNGQFIFKDNKYLLGKSDPNSDEYDIILFARGDIIEISIPPNIKIISSYAFSSCDILTKVEIPTNSNLQTIEPEAFSWSKIKEIYIPSKVSKICENTFSNCNNLTKIEISTNSNLQIYFPTSLKELRKGWCQGISNLAKIIISPLNGQFIFKDNKYLLGKSDPSSDEFDALLFARRDIKEFSIPPNIKIISSYAFYDCIKLTKVRIPANSNLQKIEKFAFYLSEIKNFFIPSGVKKIPSNDLNFNYMQKYFLIML